MGCVPLRCRRFEPRLRVESWPQGTERPAAAVGAESRAGGQRLRPPPAPTLLLLPFLELCHPLVVFGLLLGLLPPLLLKSAVGHDRFGGLDRRSEPFDGLALQPGPVEAGIEIGGEGPGFVLAGLAGCQPGVVGGQGGYLFVDFVDAGDVGGPFPATPRRYSCSFGGELVPPPAELLDDRFLLLCPFAVGFPPGPGFGLVGFPSLFQG